MTVNVTVSAKSATKDAKDQKDVTKEGKEPFKERKDTKDRKDAIKEFKEPFKERKDFKDRKEAVKEFKEPFKERKDFKDAREFAPGLAGPPAGGSQGQDYGYGYAGGDPSLDLLTELQARVGALEEALGMGAAAEPFIPSELRPDLTGGPSYGAAGGSIQQRMAGGDREAKIEYDSVPPR